MIDAYVYLGICLREGHSYSSQDSLIVCSKCGHDRFDRPPQTLVGREAINEVLTNPHGLAGYLLGKRHGKLGSLIAEAEEANEKPQ